MEEEYSFSDDEILQLSEEVRNEYLLWHMLIGNEGESDDDQIPLNESQCYVPVYVPAEASDAEDPEPPEYNEEEESDAGEEMADEVPDSEENVEQYAAKDGTIWQSKNSEVYVEVGRRGPYCGGITGPTPHTQDKSIAETFFLLFTDEMIDIIIRESNRKARRTIDEARANNPRLEIDDWKNITKEEFIGYVGLLILGGVTHSGYVDMQDLWKTTAHPLFRATMSRNRFKQINRFLRFDNVLSRPQRRAMDKAAAITDIFLMLNANLKKNYIAGPHVTVDEQLYPFRGGTGFTQYIPSKPAKYGIKVWWVCDAKTSYPLKGKIYTGAATSGEREKNVGEKVVKELCVEMFKGSGRTITCDNFFTTYNLAKCMRDDHKLCILGTVNKRRRFVPPNFAATKRREEHSSIYGYNDNITLCSYVPKKNRSVVLLSSGKTTQNVHGPLKKPHMIMDYNSTKGGVDNMDRMLSEYSTKRRTNRWPMAFFYNILDVAALAAYIIYFENQPYLSHSTSRRRVFLLDLAESLCRPQILQRSQIRRVSGRFVTRNAMEAVFGQPLVRTDEGHDEQNQPQPKHPQNIKGKCYICPRQRNTRKTCCICFRPVCAEHAMDSTKCNRCE